MVDFTPRRDFLDSMEQWQRHFTSQDNAAQQRYVDREMRSELDRRNRRNAAVSAEDQRFLADNAGLFAQAQLPTPRAAPDELMPAQSAAAGITPDPGPAQLMQAGNRSEPSSAMQGNNTPSFNEENVNAATYTNTRSREQIALIGEFKRLFPGYNTSTGRMGRHGRNTTLSSEQLTSLRLRFQAAGLDLRQVPLDENDPSRGTTLLPVHAVQNYSAESLRFPESGTISGMEPEVDITGDVNAVMGASANAVRQSRAIEQAIPGARVSSANRTPQSNRAAGGVPDSMHLSDNALDIVLPQGTSPEQAREAIQQAIGTPITEYIPEGDHLHVGWRTGSGTSPQTAGTQEQTQTAPELDQFFNRMTSMSRGMEPTPEMNMAHAVTQRMYNRAQVLAQHGDVAGADAAFNAAVQGMGAYRQQLRQALYRTAQQGDNEALAMLISDSNLYPEGTVRVNTTNERRPRYVVEVLGDDGVTWENRSEVPITREVMFSRLQNLIDAEGAAQREENYTNTLNNIRDNQTRYAIAGLELRGDILNNATQVQVAQMNNEVRWAIENGRVTETVVDTENGGVHFFYRAPDGSPAVGYVSLEEQRAPDTEGDETIDVPVVRSGGRVTGVTGVGAN